MIDIEIPMFRWPNKGCDAFFSINLTQNTQQLHTIFVISIQKQKLKNTNTGDSNATINTPINAQQIGSCVLMIHAAI